MMPQPHAAPSALVIILHGVGAFGADMARVQAGLAPHLPGAAFATPDAPEPFDGGRHACQWFSLDGVTAANRPGRIAAARPAFDRVIGGLIEAHGFGGRPERVALVGFSQGAMMALDAMASGRWQVAAVVAFCGRLATPQPIAPSLRTRLMLIHGQEDTVIPSWESEAALTCLAGYGIAAECRIEPRLGHDMSPDGMDRAGRFLAMALA